MIVCIILNNTIHLIVSIFKLTNALAECQMVVRFTPAVYKYLLGQECTLDDLKIEDPSLYKCVLVLMYYCQSSGIIKLLNTIGGIRYSISH